jgi:hypothetical protein
MKKEIRLLAVPASLPEGAKDFRFNRDWTEGEGVGLPEKVVPTNSDKVVKDDFIINFEVLGFTACWTLLASQWQARCVAANVKPYVEVDGEKVVNPNTWLTFRKNGKGRVEMSVKALTDDELKKALAA